VNFYKHHLGDYDGATAHLSWDEDMAYTRLLRAYYRREKPIGDGEKCRLARAVSKGQKAAVDSVLSEFFTLIEGHWHNKRADEEIESYQAQADTNRRIAEERERRRKGNESSNESCTNRPPAYTGKREPNHKPEPEARSQSRSKAGADAPDWLPAEWGEYERHRIEKHSKLTPTARKGCIRKLERWKAEGHDIAAILRHAIDNGYTGLFLPDRGNGKAHGVTAGNISAAQEWLRREQEKDAHENPAP
jgi:uncharacterized protein YdaU (DUF1376 family)